MTADYARGIAKRRLWTAWLNRSTLKIPLPPKYLTLRENDILILTDPADTEVFLMRIQRITRGLNYLLEVEGLIENAIDSSFTAAAENKDNNQIFLGPVPIDFEIIDIASLSDSLINTPGYYAAAYSLNPEINFAGAVLYDGTSAVLNITAGATAGSVSNALGSAGGYCWDRVNTITVELSSGTLSSVTEAQCLAGSNRAIVGSEIIGFKTATLVADNTYELSMLLRGLGDTRDQIDSHVVNEVFVLLETSKIKFKALNNNEIGSAKSFKAVPTGEYFDNVDAVAVTTNANNLRPFAPCFIRGSRDSSNNLTIQWCRRTRSQVELLTTLPIPLSEATESYEIDIMSGLTVVRTITAAAETAAYTAAQQTADGLTPGEPVTVRVYQLSAIVGRGKYGEKTL
jgi:hypothetical protein